MKKNYIIKGVALSLLFCMNACSLDKDPLSDYSEKTMGSENDTNDRVKYKDRSEMKIQYDAIYQRMKDNQEHWCLDYLLLTEVHADNAYGGTTGLELTTMEDNSVDGANICVARDWERYLTEIAQANKVICNIDAIADALFAQSEREQWKAEAKIYRAMNMFEMARFWGNFPVIISEAGDITADNIEDVYSDYFPAQNTQEEAYQQIEKDLLEAVAYAPDNNPADKTRLSKSVARALLAKVYAEKTLRDYDKVVKYSDEVIADGFTLVNEYEDLFGMNADNTDTKMRSTSESILEVNYFPGGGNWVSWMFGRNLLNWDESFTWAKWITPSRDLINAFNEEKDVVRMNQSIVFYACGWTNYYPSDHYPFMYKCRSSSSTMIKLRLADILLLKAEALANKGDLSGATKLINLIRNRAKLPDLNASAYSSKDNLLNAILKERRLELAFEGQRWFDLIRHEKLTPIMNDLNSRDERRLKQARSFSESSTILPIPQTALDQNSNLIQNPGY